MTLQASGAIAMSQLRGEFGGSAPDAISEYYRGGARVPDIQVNALVPTSGAIKLRDFYGAAVAANFSTTMTRGTDGDKVPTTGYVQSGWGSLASTTFFRGIVVSRLSSVGNIVTLTMTGVYAANRFYSLTTSLGTLLASAAGFSNPGGTTSEWFWTGIGVFASSGSETITING